MLPPQNKFRHFNPRPPWGGRPVRFTNFARIANISIHALRGEGDHTQDFLLSCPQALFQSTPSVGRATNNKDVQAQTYGISIHALRGEGDDTRAISGDLALTFQSTPSVGRATIYLRYYQSLIFNISIHALRGEGDSKNIQIYNIVFVHSAYKIIYFCDSCAFYLT